MHRFHSTPTDDEIIAFETNVKSEALSDLPLVGPHEQGFTGLLQYYVNNDSFWPHLDYLENHFSGWRSCLGDGNCFFRAFIYQYIERLLSLSLSAPDVFLVMRQSHIIARQTFNQVGFEALATEDFIHSYDETIQSLLDLSSDRIHVQQELLSEKMNDPEISNSLVVYFRLVASSYLRSNADQYEPFITISSQSTFGTLQKTNDKMVMYCVNYVEAFGKESEDLCIMALSNALNVQVNITAIDASHPTPQAYTFNQSDAVKIDLLYRPGHYDILYPRC